ncbi:MAG TPA: hypothetical protein VJR50_00390, partial [Mycobacterium sp.]|nr:hypothetical protein [Mycobacterium sp.]
MKVRGQAVIGSAALLAGLMASGGALAAPAYATCSPQARPCITDVVMKDPTTLVFNWTTGSSDAYQVRYHSTSDPDFLGIPGGTLIPENQFFAWTPGWEIRDVIPGATYVLKVQGCRDFGISSCSSEWTEWDEETFTVPQPKARTLPKVPIGDGTSSLAEKQVDLPTVNVPAP